MQTKRTVFGNRLLPYALLLPQLAVTVVFFLWPAAQAVLLVGLVALLVRTRFNPLVAIACGGVAGALGIV